MADFPRLPCAVCGRQVSSLYSEPWFVTVRENGRRYKYAYLRRHHHHGRTCEGTYTELIPVIGKEAV